MKWLFGQSNGKLNIEWQYETSGILWRLVPAGENFFVGEDRNVESKKTTFFCIDQLTGTVRWKDVGFGEDWWISIEAIRNDVVFIHEYANPGMPDHKKIHALSLKNGALLWTNDLLRFEFVSGMSVIASTETYERRVFYELDLMTGKEVSELDPSQVFVLQELNSSSLSAEVILPEIFNDEENQDAELRKNIQHACSSGSNVLTEYIRRPDYLIVGYYMSTSANTAEQNLEQHIIIVNDGTTIFKDMMSEHGRIPVPDLFFSNKNYLYYVKNNKTLTVVRLSSL